jgi:hypothetical protein
VKVVYTINRGEAVIKIDLYDTTQNMGFYEYLEGEEAEGINPIEIRYSDIDSVNSVNGKNGVYGYLEGLFQSDRCPSFLYESRPGNLIITVEVV